MLEQLQEIYFESITYRIRFLLSAQAIPIETSELAGFQELAKLTADFETSLGREGLIPDWDETKGDKLRKFSADVEIHFAVKKRKRVLAKARDLLVQSNFNTYVVIIASWI